jgi:hypothetical protein
MKILVCGDRKWLDREAIRRELLRFGRGTIVIHGAACGTDTIAGEVAVELGFEVVAVLADWKRYGRGAGPIRNKAMLKLRPDRVLAFHADVSKSKGTLNMIRQAAIAGVAVDVFEA